MRRGIVIGLLIGAGALSLAVRAPQPAAGSGRGNQEQDEKNIAVEKLTENLFVLRGGGGNTAAFVTGAGVILVDTKNPGWGQPLLDTLEKLTDKPVTTIVNTHTHGDHVSGNVEFPANVDIVVQENTRANMDRMASPPGFEQAARAQTIFQANDGRGLPKRTFKDRMTIGTGDDRVDLYHFGRGHTDGDALVVFPALRTIHFGDLFPGKQMPIIDSNNGGSGVAYPDTIMSALDGVRDVDTIITGHGAQMTWNDLREFAAFTRDFLDAVREGKKAGRTAEEIAASWSVPAKYTDYSAPQPVRLRANVETIYKEIQ